MVACYEDARKHLCADKARELQDLIGRCSQIADSFRGFSMPKFIAVATAVMAIATAIEVVTCETNDYARYFDDDEDEDEDEDDDAYEDDDDELYADIENRMAEFYANIPMSKATR